MSAADFWDKQHQAVNPKQVYWFFHPLVREYVNEQMTGVSWIWPQVMLKARLDLAYYPCKRGVSIGCGVGNLERSLRFLRVCDEIDGFDVSPASIAAAKETAEKEGVTGVRYSVADCEHLELESGRYDAAFFSHSLHHIDDVSRMLGMLKRSLAPSSLIYIDDYVGPSRDEWQDEAIANHELEPARAVWATLPDELKIMEVNPPLDLSDPSEMIRSDAITPVIEATFNVVHRAPYWGNLLFPLLTSLDGELLSQPRYQPLLRELIDKERELVASGAFERPLFAFFLARS